MENQPKFSIGVAKRLTDWEQVDKPELSEDIDDHIRILGVHLCEIISILLTDPLSVREFDDHSTHCPARPVNLDSRAE